MVGALNTASSGSNTCSISYQMNNVFQPWNTTNSQCTITNCTSIYSNAFSPNCLLNYLSSTGLYTAFRVISHGVKITSAGSANNGTTGLIVSCAPTPSASGFGSNVTAAQGGMGKVMGPVMTYSPQTIKWSKSIARVMGISNVQVMSSSELKGTISTVPTAGPFMFIGISTADGSNFAAKSQVFCELFWTVIFEDPNYTGSFD
jgi:hypothetical protein